jgi:hypothetical protein
MAVAASVFLLTTIAMFRGLEPFATWYYSFAWWSYIVFVDAWLGCKLQPRTVLGNPEFPRLLILSVAIWVSFEAYNFRLNNWHYLEIPPNLATRWIGYALAYATVLPGIFVTWRWIQILLPARSQGKKLIPSRLPSILFWAGLVTSLLPWIWPRYFFPLVWLGPTAFFSAINYWLGGEGILRELAIHGSSKLLRLLGAGAICGLLWEFWNFWARSKWAYTIPFFDQLHVFEMPLAGFFGFPPFALECHEMYWVARKVLDRLKPRPVIHGLAWLVIVLFIAVVFWGIDHFTVQTFQN